MPEWWSYSLSDFLLFSPRTYYRMMERHNQALWPGHILTIGLGALILGLLRQPSPRRGRVISAIFAMLWGWLAWAFFWKRYATINWAASCVVPVFAIEALLLVWIGTVRGRFSFRLSQDVAGRLGTALFVLSLAVYPVLAPLSGRSWRQAEVFGIAPDPTVTATIGLLLLAQGSPRWVLLTVPILWCLISGATLWAMDSSEAWLLLLSPLLIFGALAWTRSHRDGASSLAGEGES